MVMTPTMFFFACAAADGMVLREGNYLSAVAEIGALEHSLTTDLLNHLVFVQKVFMKVRNHLNMHLSFDECMCMSLTR